MRANLLTVVAAINLALAGALAWLWSDDSQRHWNEPAPLPPAIEEVAVVEERAPPEASRYRETLERPLFIATRRPGPKKDPAGEIQEAVELRDVKLLGTYGGGGKGGIIVSRGGKVERVPVGASIGQWKVVGGEGRGVTLVRANGEQRFLELALNTTAPPAATPEGAAAPSAPAATSGPTTVPASPSRPRSAAAAPGGSDEAKARREAGQRRRSDQVNQQRSRWGLPPLRN